MQKILQQACEQGEIRQLDLHIGLFLEKLAVKQEKTQSSDGKNGKKFPELLLAGTLASAAVGNGHVCQPLNRMEELPLQIDPNLIPAPKQWQQSLMATGIVGRPGTTTPLILDNRNRLYLYRFYRYEEQIAADLLQRATDIMPVDHQRAREIMAQLFTAKEEGTHQINYQQIAAALALLKRLLIISGGPGTGKTYTVARILALIQALNKDTDKPLRIGMAAPTGKAAARLEESIRKAKQSIPAELAQHIPEQAQTLHRLLGYRPGEDDFRYNRNNPLHLDLLVLDEASMIDVVMMTGLIHALPAKTRLILLGDRNQLASVEAGSLFGDLCGTAEPQWSAEICDNLRLLTGEEKLPQATTASTMADSVALLQTSYRFHDKSGIGSLASAVNSGSMPLVEQVAQQDFTDLQMEYIVGNNREEWLRQQILKGFRDMVAAPGVEDAFAAMEKFRFLCAVRKGPAGVEGINALAEQVLRKAGLIAPTTEWYQGKPIIIRRNQYDMQLFNGDTGILWENEDGQLRAWFRRSDNSLYPVTPARLPDHDTAFAITIHKSQGSEFDQVLLLLPEEESRVLSRELIYTGITRARTKLILCCDRTILAQAVGRQTLRYSGLAEKMWGSE